MVPEQRADSILSITNLSRSITLERVTGNQQSVTVGLYLRPIRTSQAAQRLHPWFPPTHLSVPLVYLLSPTLHLGMFFLLDFLFFFL